MVTDVGLPSLFSAFDYVFFPFVSFLLFWRSVFFLLRNNFNLSA